MQSGQNNENTIDVEYRLRIIGKKSLQVTCSFFRSAEACSQQLLDREIIIKNGLRAPIYFFAHFPQNEKNNIRRMAFFRSGIKQTYILQIVILGGRLKNRLPFFMRIFSQNGKIRLQINWIGISDSVLVKQTQTMKNLVLGGRLKNRWPFFYANIGENI